MCPVGIEPVNLQPSALYFIGKVAQSLNKVMEAYPDDSYLEDIGQVIDYSPHYVLKRIPYISKDGEDECLRLREDGEDECHRHKQL